MFKHICPSLLGVLLVTTSLWKTGRGMQVTSTGPLTMQRAEGDGVSLGCRYRTSPSDTGELDIEWSMINPDTTQKNQMLLSYTSGTKYIHGSGVFAHGLSFAAGDPSMGDASLTISLLSFAHSGTYQCKVKKSPGVDMLKMSLAVMVKPSVPKCWVEGGDVVGEALSLHCKVEKGSPPLRYSWTRISGGPFPATATQEGATGELRITNHSQSFAGLYDCRASNTVGAERCRVVLKANKPPNRAGVIIGTIVGSLLLVFILLAFLAVLTWKLRSRYRPEKEFSNEIREDAQPPVSRPVSRYTDRSSARCPQVLYCEVSRSEPDSFGGGRNTASIHSQTRTSVRHAYDSDY
uniref:V-set and immunoglobulin domain containing 8a n=2 Tax=Takifugu rubripes TaxID=31033 RepID=H2SII9_TAKRU